MPLWMKQNVQSYCSTKLSTLQCLCCQQIFSLQTGHFFSRPSVPTCVCWFGLSSAGHAMARWMAPTHNFICLWFGRTCPEVKKEKNVNHTYLLPLKCTRQHTFPVDFLSKQVVSYYFFYFQDIVSYCLLWFMTLCPIVFCGSWHCVLLPAKKLCNTDGHLFAGHSLMDTETCYLTLRLASGCTDRRHSEANLCVK
jgi:hypothetical protein